MAGGTQGSQNTKYPRTSHWLGAHRDPRILSIPGHPSTWGTQGSRNTKYPGIPRTSQDIPGHPSGWGTQGSRNTKYTGIPLTFQWLGHIPIHSVKDYILGYPPWCLVHVFIIRVSTPSIMVVGIRLYKYMYICIIIVPECWHVLIDVMINFL